jgi:hypothetical protein
LQLSRHEAADFPRVISQLIALHDFENFKSYRAAERVSAESCSMRPRGKKTGVRFAHPEGADWKSAAE